MKINDLGDINTAELLMKEDDALNICKQSIAVIARSLKVFTTDFPKPTQVGLKRILMIIQSIKDDRHCNMPAETALLVIACSRLNPNDEGGLYSRLSNMAYYLACNRRRITQFPNIDNEMLQRLSEIDPANYSSVIFSLTCYGRVATAHAPYKTDCHVQEKEEFQRPTPNEDTNVILEYMERNYTSMSAIFGPARVERKSFHEVEDLWNRLCKSYDSCLSPHDPIDGNYPVLLVLNLCRGEYYAVDYLKATAHYMASCGYAVELCGISFLDVQQLGETISKEGVVSREALHKVQQRGILNKIKITKMSTDTAHSFPSRLLKELEALPDMSAVLDRVIKYQMLCSEETRRQDSKEALLVGFKYSLDIGT